MPLDIENGLVELAHGNGGRAMSNLIDELFIPAFTNPILEKRNDQAHLELPSTSIVTATDSHVISPLFFPGGDIGCLSIYGTINDVAMSGAKPLYLSVGFILEEGYPLSELKRIVDSMAKAADECGVKIVTGDTKVVEKGKGDGVFINTTGIGSLAPDLHLSPSNIQVGDKILVNGFIGDHGMAIMSYRERMNLDSDLISDCQPLHDLTKTIVDEVPSIRCMRDPTRGGVAATLNELCQGARKGMVINESEIPVRDKVKACCEILGLDPLYIANEGKLIAICPAEDADNLLKAMRNHPHGKDSAIIGEVTEDTLKLVQLQSAFGGIRLIDWRYSDPLPRIC